MIVLRDLAKLAALVLTILSIYALLGSVFFIPGTTWQLRLESSIQTLVMTGCVCFASGLLFRLTTHPEPAVIRTLPVRLFFWSLGGVVLMFLLSRYLEVYYIPYDLKHLPR
jgi:cation transport ATPase